MATLGSIRAELIADSDRWGKGLGTARTSLGKFQKFALGSFAAVAAAGGAAAGIFATKILPQFDKLDQVAKLSANTGFATEDLMSYQFAAEQSGVATETLNRGLQRFVRTTGDAKNGVGAAVDGFGGLGIAVRDLEGLSLDQQLRLTAQRLSEIDDPATKAAAAYKLFGRQGQDLLNFLNNGSRGLQDFRKQADNLGLLFSADQLGNIESANDAMNEVAVAVEAIWKRIAVGAAPSVEDLADKLQTLGEDDQNIHNITEAVSALTEALGALAEATVWTFDKLKISADFLVTGWTKIGEEVGLLSEGTTKELMKMNQIRERVAGNPVKRPQRNREDDLKDDLPARQNTAIAQGGRGPMRFLIEQAAQFAKQGGQAFREELEKAEAAHQRMVQRQEELADRTLAIIERNKTGIELAYDRLTDFREVQNQVGVNTQQRELIAIRDEFLASLPQPEETKQPAPTQFAAAVQRGSAGAFSAIAAAMRQDQDNDRAIPQKQLLVTQEQKTLLDSLNQQIAALNGKVLPNEKLVPIKTLKGGGR